MIGLLSTAFFVFLIYPAIAAAQPPQAQVEISFPIRPIPFRAGNRTQIAYEIHLTNFSRNDLSLRSLEVSSRFGALIRSFEASDLIGIIKKVGTPDDFPTPDTMEGGAE